MGIFSELQIEGRSLLVGLVIFIIMRIANAALPKGYHFKVLDRFLAKNETSDEDEKDDLSPQKEKGTP